MVKRSASAVREYFTMFQNRLEIAKCNICCQKIRRGPPGASIKNFEPSLYGASKFETMMSIHQQKRSGPKKQNKKRKF